MALIGVNAPPRDVLASRDLLPGFVRNVGAFNPSVRFVARGPGMRVMLTDDGIWLCLGSVGREPKPLHVVKLAFVDGQPTIPIAEGQSHHPVTMFRGNPELSFDQDVAPTSRIRWKGVWDGVDVVMHRDRGVLEYDVEARDAASLRKARFRWIGAESPSEGANGSLVTRTSVGELGLMRTVGWTLDGTNEPVASSHVLFDDGSFGLQCERDFVRPVCIDPGIVFSGYLGGSGLDAAFGIARGPDGSFLVTGETASPDFPATPGALDVTLAGTQYDAFVAKIAPGGGSLLWATFLGGSGSADRGMAIASDASGAAFITGGCAGNWPTTPGAFDASYNQWGDAFVAKLGPNGNTLMYSTYLGGASEDRGYAIAVDASGAAYVTGKTQSANYPVVGGAVSTPVGGWDIMLTKVNPTGTALDWSTRIGGSSIDWGFALALAPDGGVLVGGSSASTDFVTTMGVPNAGGLDGFVAKYTSNGQTCLWSAMIGGPISDQGLALCAMPDGGAVLAGLANQGFPDSFATPTIGQDIFAARFGTTGLRLWSRVIGGSSTEQAQAVALDDIGRVIVTGSTNSFDFPTTWDACDSTYAGGGTPGDGILAVLDPLSGALIHGTFIGGNGYDDLRSAVVIAPCKVVVAGVGNSTDLTASVGSFGTSAPGLDDALVSCIELPAAATVANVALPCGANPPTFVCGRPVLGTTPLLTVSGTPLRDGLLLVSGIPQGAPLTISGCVTALDLATATFLLPLWVDGLGQWGFPLPLPANTNLAGLQLRLQVALLEPTSPMGFTTTNGVELRLGN